MTIHSRAELIELLDQGRTFEYLFFYGHQPKADGTVGESCCSQWFEASFEIVGVTYATAEHFMMAEKARLFNDLQTLEKVINCKTPKEAKALGRAVSNFDSHLWKQHASQIVIKGNLAKFQQNAALGQWLMSTAEKVLVEASLDDRIWGIGMERSNVDAQDPRKWNGENQLGFALMQARERLIESSN